LSAHAVFAQLVLSAVALKSRTESPLALLRGYELSVLIAVADYLGIYRGSQLRHLREASRCLKFILGPEIEPRRPTISDKEVASVRKEGTLDVRSSEGDEEVDGDEGNWWDSPEEPE
jgi:hypothetical protein